MKSAFRVVHIIGGGEFGGAEDHIIHLLKQLRQEGIDAHVVCFYDSVFAKILREHGITVDVLSYGRFDIRLLHGLATLLKNKNPDIIHTHGVKANFFGRIAAKRIGVFPVVTTVHSLLKYDYSHPFAYRMARLLEKMTRSKTDYYIAISNKIKEQLVTEGIQPSKIQMIHHGIDIERFAPREDVVGQALAEQWGKEAGTYLIGAVGRLQSVKGFNYFIQACAALHKENPDVFRFVLIGDGPQRAELEQLVESEQLGDVFHFAGFREDVDSCLRALDCYVSSSLSEGLGLAVMEALATGVPVVTTGVGGIKDFAEDEKNCLMVESESVEQLTNALVKMHANQELMLRLSEQGVMDMRTFFSLEQMGKRTALYYRKWLGRE